MCDANLKGGGFNGRKIWWEEDLEGGNVGGRVI